LDASNLLGSVTRRLRSRGPARIQLNDLESMLCLGRSRVRIHAPAANRSSRRLDPAQPIPDPAWEGLELLAKSNLFGRDVRQDIDDGEAIELWTRTTEIASSLKERGLVPGSHQLPSGLRTFSELAAVVAEGSSYAELPLSRLLGNDGEEAWAGAGSETAGWRGRLFTIEIMVISLWAAFTKDFRSAKWLARQPLRGGFRGLCRHYAHAMQVLFSCARRADSSLDRWLVLTLGGRPHPAVPFGHAWNWLVSRDGKVFAFDLTAADWMLDRGHAPNVFNPAFDATRWWNVSVFAANLANAYALFDGIGYRNRTVADLFKQVANPETLAGQAMLHRVTAQGVFHKPAQQRIVQELRRRRFDEARARQKIWVGLIPAPPAISASVPQALDELLDHVFS